MRSPSNIDLEVANLAQQRRRFEADRVDCVEPDAAAVYRRQLAIERSATGTTTDAMGIGASTKRLAAIQRARAERAGRRAQIDFRKPVTRPERPRNHDGLTTIYFSHEPISRRSKPHVSRGGVRSGPSAASQHSDYITRVGAVATAESASIERSSPAPGHEYIARPTAVAEDEAGAALVRSSISDDPMERRRFWQAVEACERKAGTDKVSINLAMAPAFWRTVSEDPALPAALRECLTKGEPPCKVSVPSNTALRRVLRRHGWTSERSAELGVRFHDSRAGRVQFRIVGELPHEVPHPARVRIWERMCAEFDRLGLPYTAALHRPDEASDQRNWHFHLDYYDRPAKLFTNRPEDYLASTLSSSTASKVARQGKVDIGSPELEAQVGRWDFEVTVTKKSASRHTRTTRPFAQPKNREVHAKGFPMRLRARLAELTNVELEAVGAERRVSPHSNESLGIGRGGHHLGNAAAAAEARGEFVATGAANEMCQWQNQVQDLRRRHSTQAEGPSASGNQPNASSDLANAKFEAELTLLTFERAASRAKKVRAAAKATLKKAAKNATAADRRRMLEAQDRLDAATGYLTELHAAAEPMLKAAKTVLSCCSEIDRDGKTADVTRASRAATNAPSHPEPPSLSTSMQAVDRAQPANPDPVGSAAPLASPNGRPPLDDQERGRILELLQLLEREPLRRIVRVGNQLSVEANLAREFGVTPNALDRPECQKALRIVDDHRQEELSNILEYARRFPFRFSHKQGDWAVCDPGDPDKAPLVKKWRGAAPDSIASAVAQGRQAVEDRFNTQLVDLVVTPVSPPLTAKAVGPLTIRAAEEGAATPPSKTLTEPLGRNHTQTAPCPAPTTMTTREATKVTQPPTNPQPPTPAPPAQDEPGHHSKPTRPVDRAAIEHMRQLASGFGLS